MTENETNMPLSATFFRKCKLGLLIVATPTENHVCFTTNVFPAMLAYAAPLCKTILENAKPAFGLLIVAKSTENHVCYATNVFSATLAFECCITM